MSSTSSSGIRRPDDSRYRRHAYVSAALTGTKSVSNSSINYTSPSAPMHSPKSALFTYLLIQYPHLHPCIPPILLEDTAQRPPLKLPITPHDGTRTMATHVAAYEGGEGGGLKEEGEGVDDEWFGRGWEGWEVVCAKPSAVIRGSRSLRQDVHCPEKGTTPASVYGGGKWGFRET
jgi:hypothetical protein